MACGRLARAEFWGLLPEEVFSGAKWSWVEERFLSRKRLSQEWEIASDHSWSPKALLEERPEGERSRSAPAQEDLEVLQGGDELVLDGLAGEPAPTRAFKAMLCGGLGEVALLQPLAAFPIALRGWAMGLAAGSLQKEVARIAVEAPARLGPGAVRDQRADIALRL